LTLVGGRPKTRPHRRGQPLRLSTKKRHGDSLNKGVVVRVTFFAE
jgi:hypothetical protein